MKLWDWDGGAFFLLLFLLAYLSLTAGLLWWLGA